MRLKTRRWRFSSSPDCERADRQEFRPADRIPATRSDCCGSAQRPVSSARTVAGGVAERLSDDRRLSVRDDRVRRGRAGGQRRTLVDRRYDSSPNGRPGAGVELPGAAAELLGVHRRGDQPLPLLPGICELSGRFTGLASGPITRLASRVSVRPSRPCGSLVCRFTRCTEEVLRPQQRDPLPRQQSKRSKES